MTIPITAPNTPTITMPTELHGIKAADVHAKIRLLIDGLVNITDTTGEFLMTLEDGRVIDTKGWNDWVRAGDKPATTKNR